MCVLFSYDMSVLIGKQMNLCCVWIFVVGVMGIFGFVLGMLIGLFLFVVIGVGLVVYFNLFEMVDDDMVEVDLIVFEGGEVDGEFEGVIVDEVIDYVLILFQIGYGLIQMVGDGGGVLVLWIIGICCEVFKLFGFVVLGVCICDELSLLLNQYCICIGNCIVGEDVIYLDWKLVLFGGFLMCKLCGIEVKDLLFGMDVVWILL